MTTAEYWRAEPHTRNSPALRIHGIRRLEERDISGVLRLFDLNYGADYMDRSVYRVEWLKRCIHGGREAGLVLENAGEVTAFCTLDPEYGGRDDQAVEIKRLVVHPQAFRQGAGGRMIEAALDLAADLGELFVGHNRCTQVAAQRIAERKGFRAVGLVPQQSATGGRSESLVVYARMSPSAWSLRCERPPRVIPEAVALASHVLSVFGARSDVDVVDAAPLPPAPPCRATSLTRELRDDLITGRPAWLCDRVLLGPGRVQDPQAERNRLGIRFEVALDLAGTPVGAMGWRWNPGSKALHAVHLAAADGGVTRFLLSLLSVRASELRANRVEAAVSARMPCAQRALYEAGFTPTAYVPALAHNRGERLDVVRMTRLYTAQVGAGEDLTEAARAVVSIVRRDERRL